MNTLDRSIDLLIDGELDEGARRILLEKLDAEPDGWRRCALAFLEAQAWQSAVKIAAKPASNPVFVLSKPIKKNAAMSWLARAACVLVVFAVGWSLGRNRGESRPTEVVRAAPTIAPTTVAARPTESETPPPQAPSYLQAKLEREGFKIEQRVMIVPGRTPSGQRVNIPIEQTKVRFVGNRSI